jgi:hypothetical protein
LSTISLHSLQFVQPILPLFVLKLMSLVVNIPVWLVEALLLLVIADKKFPFLYVAPLGYSSSFKKIPSFLSMTSFYSALNPLAPLSGIQ